MKRLTMAAAVLGMAIGLSAHPDTAEPRGLTGTWNMGLQGGHVIPVALVLAQEGDVLTGTVSLPTQASGSTVDVALKGEIAGGTFTMSGSVDGAKEPTTITITGRLNEEGTLEGRMSMSGADGPHRNMPYTAERLKERK